MSSRSGIPNDLASLLGKRLVTASELNESVKLNEARLKMLAGEDPVTARFLYAEHFTFLPVAKFWLSVNHKPIVNDDSTGFWRKIHLIPFTQSFEGRADRNLKEALRAEYPGILAWMVRGCLAWQTQGLSKPAAVNAATATYRAESDPIAVFLRERCVINEACRVKASEFYRAYQDWADDTGLKERERLSNSKFGRIMTERFRKKEESSGNTYVGVGLQARGMEGCLSSNPPFSVSPHEDNSGESYGNQPPLPSIQREGLSDNPPADPPPSPGDPPRCAKCGVAMSAIRVRDVCGRCQR
jgi:putative DNA primase/helicase